MNDLKFAIRQLLKNPGFTAVAVLTLALGIGANTAIFSVVNAVLLRPPPFKEPGRLVFVSEKSKDMDNMSVSYPNFRDWQRQQAGFSSLAAFRTEEWNLTGTSQPERVVGLQVSASFFPTLGVQPRRGRVFAADEDKIGGERVVVLSEGLWQRRFGSDPAVLDRPISLNGESYTVVGILPAAFQFPRRVELWTPVGHKAAWTEARGWHPGMYVIGRLKPGIELPAARRDLEGVAARLAKEYPDSNTGNSVTVMALQERLAGPSVRTALATLLGAVLVVLLIACTNVTNLLLGRATQRRKEIAVRLALGAGRRRLLRQLLVESLLLAGAGGLAGLVLALWGMALLTNLQPAQLRDLVTLNIDRTVLLFSFAVAVTTGLLFGLAPAWQLANGDSAEALKEGGRSESVAVGRGWGRGLLIVGEVAFALMLLVAAGLLLRSFSRLQAVPVGLDPENVLTMDLRLPPYKYPDDPKRARFYQQAVEAVRGLPGVRSAAFIAPLPMGFGGWQSGVRIEGEPPARPGQGRLSDFAIVTPDYFKTMGVIILKGRAFTEADLGSDRVCIVDETFERKHFNGDALGKRLANGGDGTNWMTIVGVARHVKNYGAGEDSRIESSEEHFKHWTGFYDRAAFLDGIIIKEFIVNRPVSEWVTTMTDERRARMEQERRQYGAFGEAIKKMRADDRYKSKTLYAYVGGSGKKLNQVIIGTNFIRTILDCVYRVALERYLHEMSSEKGSQDALQAFTDGIADWEAKEPGVKKQMVIAFGLFSMPRGGLNKLPNVDYHVWMDQQMNTVANNPELSGIGGLEWWTTTLTDEETTRFVGKLYRHYAIEGKTEMLTKDPLFPTHIQTADFEQGPNRRTVHP